MNNGSKEKILVYADVHGNYDALKKLKKSHDYKTATKIIFLGDAVMMGDEPYECLKEILSGTEIYLLGNHDSYSAYGLPKEMVPSEKKLSHQTFMRNQIPENLRQELKTKEKELYLSLCGKTLYFAHYLWESEFDVEDELEGTDLTPENFDKKFKRIKADIIFVGHDHYPSHHIFKQKEYYVVGSLGMKIPAKYIVIEAQNNSLKIRHKTLHYNYKKVKKRMIKKDYPGAKVYAEYFEN